DVVSATSIRLFATASLTGNPVVVGTLPAGGQQILSATLGGVTVSATTKVDMVHFAGQPIPYINSNASSGNATGGTLLQVGYTNVTQALIEAGAIVYAGSLAVTALTDTRNIALVTTSAIGDGKRTLVGSVEVLTTHDLTNARID